jgi:hypothetical protein
MTSGASAMKWTGLWLLQIPVYLVTSYLIRTLITVGYLLLLRAGVSLPANLLLEHFLWVGLVGGFVAGLVGVLLFRAMLLLPVDLKPPTETAWVRPQAWTWVLPSYWLATGVIAWLGNRGHGSVLDVSPEVRGLGMFAAFFGSGCYLGSGDFHAIALGSCMSQTTFTHPWLGTLGYSAAAFFPLGRIARKAPAEDTASPDHEVQAAH